jgi:hypothetical protein
MQANDGGAVPGDERQKEESRNPSMRNRLDKSSVAQILDGIARLMGSLRFPLRPC